MRQAIIGVPKELIESAKIDGAGDMKILWKVILPLVKSAMMTLAIFTFVGAWNNFLWPFDCDDGGCDAYSAPCHQHDADSL